MVSARRRLGESGSQGIAILSESVSLLGICKRTGPLYGEAEVTQRHWHPERLQHLDYGGLPRPDLSTPDYHLFRSPWNFLKEKRLVNQESVENAFRELIERSNRQLLVARMRNS